MESRVTDIFEYDRYKNWVWADIIDSAPYLTIGYANIQSVIKLLYSNWCHYSPLIQSSCNSLISRKIKPIKGKKIEVVRDIA